MAEAGRPVEYHEELTPKLAEALARQGLNNEEIAEGIGIAPSTLYLWQDAYPSFSEALKRGKGPVDQRVQNAFMKRAVGYTIPLKRQVLDKDGQVVTLEYDVHVPGDTSAASKWLNNRMAQEWRDKQPEGQGNDQQLRIVLDNQTNNPEYMANVEIHIPTKEKSPE